MKILLTTLNARFSHTSLALRYLRGALNGVPAVTTELREYTINQETQDILQDIFLGEYDAVCFSTYIWNVERIAMIGRNLRKVQPDVRILLGGPEVSFDTARFLNANPWVDGVLIGEGEETIRAVFETGFSNPEIYRLPGTAWNLNGQVAVNSKRPLISNLDSIPFPYEETDDLEHRLAYYESSRGCPYSCRYCLSSAEEGIRHFSVERVRKDLSWFLEKRVGTVKFVDRTFNAVEKHFVPILEFIREQDNGHTCFHLEISAAILSKDIIEWINGFRPGLIQMEIGVQSTCTEALEVSGRPDWTARIAERVSWLHQGNNIHLHLDLIAGLPFEGFDRFMESFDGVYAMKPHLLQLGFLKLIRGTELRERSEEFGYTWTEEAPYEVLSSKWISYGETLRLKRLEHVLETVHGSGRFPETLKLIEALYIRPSELYLALTEWFENQAFFERPHSAEAPYLWLYAFGVENGLNPPTLRTALRLDLVRHYKPRSHRGTVLEGYEADKGLLHELLHKQEGFTGQFSACYGVAVKQLMKELHFEILPNPDDGEDAIWVFDIQKRPSELLTILTLSFAKKLVEAGKTDSLVK